MNIALQMGWEFYCSDGCGSLRQRCLDFLFCVSCGTNAQLHSKAGVRYSFQTVHDLNYFRDHLDLFKEMARKRRTTIDIDGFVRQDAARRELITRIEQLKALRNKKSEEIARLKKAGQDGSELIS